MNASYADDKGFYHHLNVQEYSILALLIYGQFGALSQNLFCRPLYSSPELLPLLSSPLPGLHHNKVVRPHSPSQFS
jgi:hypothetical protein